MYWDRHEETFSAFEAFGRKYVKTVYKTVMPPWFALDQPYAKRQGALGIEDNDPQTPRIDQNVAKIPSGCKCFFLWRSVKNIGGFLDISAEGGPQCISGSSGRTDGGRGLNKIKFVQV